MYYDVATSDITRLGLPANQSVRAEWGGKLILLALLLTVLEGAFRKWVVPGLPPARYLAYISKDVVILCAGLAGMHLTLPRYRRAASYLLAISVALILPSTLFNAAVNPAGISPVGMALSLRSYIVFPMCVFFAAGTIRSMRDIDRILVVIGILMIFVTWLGYVQYYLPIGHVLNRYETEGKDIAAIGGHARVTGTFSYITGMALFGVVGVWVGLCMLFTASSLFRRGFAVAVILAGVGCVTLTMSRGPVLFSVVIVGFSLLLLRRVKETVCVAAMLAVLIGVFVVFPPEQLKDKGIHKGLMARFEAGETGGQGVRYRIAYLLSGITTGLQHPLGVGLGAGQQGGNYVISGARNWGQGAPEGSLGRICYEVGWLGFLGAMIWKFAILRIMWVGFRSSKDPRIRALLAASLPAFAVMGLLNSWFMHTGAAFAWIIGTVSLGAIALEQQFLYRDVLQPGILPYGTTEN